MSNLISRKVFLREQISNALDAADGNDKLVASREDELAEVIDALASYFADLHYSETAGELRKNADRFANRELDK